MRRAFLPAAPLVVLALLLPVAATAQDQKGLMRNVVSVFAPPSPEEQQKIAATVELNDEQKQQMKEVSDRYRSQAQTLRGKYQTAYDDVVSLMESTEPDKGNVAAKLKNFHSVHQQIVDVEVQYWIDFKTILTPEQNKKFWNLFAQSRIH
ncbi:MAG: periplasmic heavy metal sensor [Acidobacteriota bacterium]|jgi:Spy/CpxP family protein refolding chaperone